MNLNSTSGNPEEWATELELLRRNGVIMIAQEVERRTSDISLISQFPEILPVYDALRNGGEIHDTEE